MAQNGVWHGAGSAVTLTLCLPLLSVFAQLGSSGATGQGLVVLVRSLARSGSTLLALLQTPASWPRGALVWVVCRPLSSVCAGSPGSRSNGPAPLEPRWVFVSCSPGWPLEGLPADLRSGPIRDYTPAPLGVQSCTHKLLTAQNASRWMPSPPSCCLVSSMTSPLALVGEAAP